MKHAMRWVSRLMIVMMTAVLPPQGASAHTGEADTYLVEVGSGTIDLTPGLCLPGDLLGCAGPQEAQFRVQFDECTVSGRFEGVDLPADSPCDGVNHGRTFGSVQGWTQPACGSTYSYSTDDTDAWSTSGNSQTINGMTRNEFIEVRNLGVTLTVNGWLDDADPDDDPVGDHSLVAIVRTQPTNEGGCRTAPGTSFTFTSVALFQ